MITLTPEQEESIITGAKAELVRHLIKTRGEKLELLTGSQVCGMMNITQKTLDTLKGRLPRVVIAPGMNRYRISDVEAFIEERTER